MVRPVSVAVVCWVLIALALEAIVGSLSSFTHAAMSQVISGPMPLSMAIKIGMVLKVFEIVLAVCMLYGMAWSRIAYTCVAALTMLGLMAQTFLHGALLLVAAFAVLRTIVIVIVLFRAPANAYFSGRSPPPLRASAD